MTALDHYPAIVASELISGGCDRRSVA